MRAFEQLQQRMFSTYGHLKSPEFFASRQQLYRQLDAQLKSAFLNKQLNLGSYDSLRRDLGISTKSLVHHWSRAGAPGEIPGYATHLEQVSKTAKYLKYGGYVGIALGGGVSALTVQEVCRAEETGACKKIRFTSGRKLLRRVRWWCCWCFDGTSCRWCCLWRSGGILRRNCYTSVRHCTGRSRVASWRRWRH